jgi:hypothetical protein
MGGVPPFAAPARSKVEFANADIHPRRQMISKTDLAKYEHSWSQLPHIVSRYAQKCYLDFMDRLDARGGFVPNEEYFREAMARAIMFKQTERIVSRQKFGGHRAEIVTYSLAWLSHHTAMRVDLEGIWAAQSMPDALSNFLETVGSCAPACHRASWWSEHHRMVQEGKMLGDISGDRYYHSRCC